MEEEMQQLWGLGGPVGQVFCQPIAFFFKGVQGRHQVKVMVCHEEQMAGVNFNLLLPLNIMHEFHWAKDV